jgi:hypothetical protein
MKPKKVFGGVVGSHDERQAQFLGMESGNTEMAFRLRAVKDYKVRDTFSAESLANSGVVDGIFLSPPVQNPDTKTTNH